MRWELVENPQPIPPHTHEFCEIGIVLSGAARHETEVVSKEVERGDVFLSFPQSVHSFKKVRGLRKLNVYYIPEWFLSEFIGSPDGSFVSPLFFYDSFDKSEHRGTVCFKLDEADIAVIERELCDTNRPPDPVFKIKWLTACFTKVILILARAYMRWHQLEDRRIPEKIFRMLEELEKSAATGSSINFSSLARKLGMDRDYLTRQFRDVLGASPMEYFQRRRIQLTCRRILETDFRLSEIAADMGFNDESHLNRLFKREMGISPGQYRKKFRFS